MGRGLPVAQARDNVSRGMAIGTIEVPPSGELLVLAKSRGSLGGYPVIAHVIVADWPILAQLRPGDSMTFVAVTPESAHSALIEREQQLMAELEVGLGPGMADAGAMAKVSTVTAPTAGTVYRSSAPGLEPLATVGQFVKKDQTLALLEVMKQFFDLLSPTDGYVKSVAFADGVTVAEGAMLFEIVAASKSRKT